MRSLYASQAAALFIHIFGPFFRLDPVLSDVYRVLRPMVRAKRFLDHFIVFQ